MADAVRELVLGGSAPDRWTRLGDYRDEGGYEQLARARTIEPQQVLDELLASNLRGRGGAFFAMGRKAGFIPKPDQTTKPVYLVVNADESEPGTFKDREILFRVPHRLLEGCLITAHAIGSRNVFIYIRGEYLEEFEILRDALVELRDEGLLGDVTIVVHRGAGAYICGEETALLESLEGERGQPRTKPPFPAIQGLYASPTLINNVETIATVPLVLAMGGAEYAKIGTPDSTGTRVISLSGNVVNGGNYELPLGTSLRELIYDLGGGIPDGRELKAIIPGGSSVQVLTADQVDTPLSYDAMNEAGSSIGSGAVIVIDDRCCMVQLGLRVAQFYMHESCGKCLCPLGDAAAMPVASYVDKFRTEFQAHVDAGGCPYGGESSLERVFAPVDQHTHQPTVEVPA